MDEVDNVIQQLRDDALPVTAAHFNQLSDLGADSAGRFADGLSPLSFERRRAVLTHLVELAEESVDLNFDSIFRKSMHDEDEEVREIAINGLWECEERSLIDPLLHCLRNDEEERVRSAAALSLGRFAMLAELGKLLERDANKVETGLLEALEKEEEGSFEVRRRTIEALAPFNTLQVREIILESYESVDEKIRASALYAMGQNGDASWIPYILEEMESTVPEVRFEAAGAAGRLHDESLVPALARMGNDDNPEVQSSVVTALNAIGGPTAQRVLRRFLQHNDDRMRELALDALDNMQTQEAPGTDLLRRTSPGAASDPFDTDDENDPFEEFDDDLELDDEDQDEDDF